MEKTIYMTGRGVEKLTAELEHLRNVKLLEVIERLQDAREGGDTIDNTEYLAVKDEMSFVEGRIEEIEHLLRHAQLIEPRENGGVVQMGSTAVIQADGDEIETYMIVGTAEADPSAGLISDESPLGQALLNHKADDIIIVKTPDGLLNFRIVAIN